VALAMLFDFLALAQECAPEVPPQTMESIVRVESGFNPYAIGVVGGRLARQPENLAEAIATARALESAGWNYSLGLAQINKTNFPQHNLTIETAFDGCRNLQAGAKILTDCYSVATEKFGEAEAWARAFSCYYSGNFSRGLRPDAPGQLSYADKVAANLDVEAASPVKAIPVIPASSSGPAEHGLKPHWRDAEPMMYTTNKEAKVIF
jgi:type IV secretion system protein VirB1